MLSQRYKLVTSHMHDLILLSSINLLSFKEELNYNTLKERPTEIGLALKVGIVPLMYHILTSLQPL